ncbi:hypothetical protein FB451DRAFT_1445543 [Mycena latifolia]|nr:hypothetical protein FB451DRAFT_1445543 [Mycena latifolia]
MAGNPAPELLRAQLLVSLLPPCPNACLFQVNPAHCHPTARPQRKRPRDPVFNIRERRTRTRCMTDEERRHVPARTRSNERWMKDEAMRRGAGETDGWERRGGKGKRVEGWSARGEMPVDRLSRAVYGLNFAPLSYFPLLIAPPARARAVPHHTLAGSAVVKRWAMVRLRAAAYVAAPSRPRCACIPATLVPHLLHANEPAQHHMRMPRTAHEKLAVVEAPYVHWGRESAPRTTYAAATCCARACVSNDRQARSPDRSFGPRACARGRRQQWASAPLRFLSTLPSSAQMGANGNILSPRTSTPVASTGRDNSPWRPCALGRRQLRSRDPCRCAARMRRVWARIRGIPARATRGGAYSSTANARADGWCGYVELQGREGEPPETQGLGCVCTLRVPPTRVLAQMRSPTTFSGRAGAGRTSDSPAEDTAIHVCAKVHARAEMPRASVQTAGTRCPWAPVWRLNSPACRGLDLSANGVFGGVFSSARQE